MGAIKKVALEVYVRYKTVMWPPTGILPWCPVLVTVPQENMVLPEEHYRRAAINDQVQPTYCMRLDF